MNVMSETEALNFAKASALAVFDYCANVNYAEADEGDYRSFEEAIAGYRDNIRDTLNGHYAYDYEEGAFAIFDAEVENLRTTWEPRRDV